MTLPTLSMNVAITMTAPSVMEGHVPCPSSVSTLNPVGKIVLRTQTVPTMMESAMFLHLMTPTTVPIVLKEEHVLGDAELLAMTRIDQRPRLYFNLSA